MKTFIPLLLLLASCSASHKLKTSEKKTVDSVATTTRDSIYVNNEETSVSTLQAQDIHIRIDYPAGVITHSDGTPVEKIERTGDWSAVELPGWSPDHFVTQKKSTGNRTVDAIRDAISSAGSSGRLPSSIRIDIGSISDSSGHFVKKDSGAARATANTHLQTTEEVKSKEVTRTGLAWWAWVLIVLGLLYGIYRLNKKFNWVKIFP